MPGRSPRAPRGYYPTPPAGGRATQSVAYARRRRHPLTHLYAKHSQQLDSWAGRAGRAAGWAGHILAVTSPPSVRAGAREVTGRPDRLGRGPDRPVQAEKEKGKTTGETGGTRQGVGQEFAGIASPGLKIEEASDKFHESSMNVRSGCLYPRRRDVDTCRAGRRHLPGPAGRKGDNGEAGQTPDGTNS